MRLVSLVRLVSVRYGGFSGVSRALDGNEKKTKLTKGTDKKQFEVVSWGGKATNRLLPLWYEYVEGVGGG